MNITLHDIPFRAIPTKRLAGSMINFDQFNRCDSRLLQAERKTTGASKQFNTSDPFNNSPSLQ